MIHIIAQFLTALVAIEHLLILWIEMFAWENVGKKTFKSIPADLFTPTKTMAANQGLYNGFLAAGLIWSFFVDDALWVSNLQIFFLICVVAAGVFGAITASRKIFFMQAVPALLALSMVILSR